MDLQEPENLTWPRLWPLKPANQPSSPSPVLTSCKEPFVSTFDYIIKMIFNPTVPNGKESPKRWFAVSSTKHAKKNLA